MAVKNLRTEKPKAAPQQDMSFLAEQEARRILSERSAFRPTGELIMLNTQAGDLDGNNQLNKIVFEVKDIGPEVAKKNESREDADKILPGRWIQMKPSSQIIVVDWGLRDVICIPDFTVCIIFQENPFQALQEEIEKQKFIKAAEGGMGAKPGMA